MTKASKVKFGDNTVEYLGHYGGDLTIGLSAWTSTSRALPAEKRARLHDMLNSLAHDGHETPFEKTGLHFLVTTDIATHIHLLKHRIGVAINAESARYKELKDKGYLPFDWPEDDREALAHHIETSTALYHDTIKRLEAAGFTRARAKESARFYLPYATQITSDVMFNWRSFWHFLTLRYHTSAQAEVRRVALEMLTIVRDLPKKPFEGTLVAFGLTNENGDIRRPFRKGDFLSVPVFE